MLHHMTVHFPIALLFVAGGLYIFAVFRPKHPYSQSAFLLHILGTLGMGISILTGRQQKSAVATGSPEALLLQTHEIWAYVLIWLFSMLLLWRYLRLNKIQHKEQWAFCLLFVIALGMMSYSAYLGGLI